MTELVGGGGDLVRILTKLTDDVERFDSVVLSQRKVLEHLEVDNDQFNRQAERISAEAAQVVARARQAIDELSRLAEPAEPRISQTAHRGPRVRARGIRAQTEL